MRINHAYEVISCYHDPLTNTFILQVLSDDNRRSRYDEHGEVDTPTAPHNGGGGFTFRSPHGQTFTFTFNNFHHHQQHHQPQDGISSQHFFNDVVPNSSKKPHLLLFYHNFCFNCGPVQRVWQEVREVRILLWVWFAVQCVPAGADWTRSGDV